ncbi:MAG TPA: LytTR family DNA-binding domain-containing protein [Gemmatimonadaceae bacterium]|nr:LytTR family DNA-binding domain-containing protein [Gemmatimonadaceae bacterium]
MKIRCLIVDDEPLGRDRIASLLRAMPDAEVVGECETGADAIRAIEEQSPDLLFLDVQMPAMDGFSVLASVPAEKMPTVIFVTAYNEYAIKAFQVHAQDYLLKPFDPDRFYDAFRHAAARIRRGRESDGSTSDVLSALGRARTGAVHRDRVPIRSAGRVFFIDVGDIDWVEAADNYVKVHAKGETHVVRQTLQRMEEWLSPKNFVRIHRSTIVNVARIREIQPWFGGEYVVLLRDGTKVNTSRRYRSRLEVLME